MTILLSPSETIITRKFPYPTSHDIIKTIAVIIMIIDHYGVYFAPDQSWWRAIGRISFPVWFFLIGHARSRQISSRLLIGAGILVLANWLTGIIILPLNALWSIIFIRLSLDFITSKIGKSDIALILVLFVLMLIDPILNLGWEYGGMAFIFALCGHYWRNGFNDNKIIPHAIGAVALAFFIYSEQQVFNFTLAPLSFMSIGTFLVMAALFFYLPKQGPALPTTNKFLLWPLTIGGRYTLEIYVLHLLLFKAIHFALEGCAPSYCLLQLI